MATAGVDVAAAEEVAQPSGPPEPAQPTEAMDVAEEFQGHLANGPSAADIADIADANHPESSGNGTTAVSEPVEPDPAEAIRPAPTAEVPIVAVEPTEASSEQTTHVPEPNPTEPVAKAPEPSATEPVADLPEPNAPESTAPVAEPSPAEPTAELASPPETGQAEPPAEAAEPSPTATRAAVPDARRADSNGQVEEPIQVPEPTALPGEPRPTESIAEVVESNASVLAEPERSAEPSPELPTIGAPSPAGTEPAADAKESGSTRGAEPSPPPESDASETSAQLTSSDEATYEPATGSAPEAGVDSFRMGAGAGAGAGSGEGAGHAESASLSWDIHDEASQPAEPHDPPEPTAQSAELEHPTGPEPTTVAREQPESIASPDPILPTTQSSQAEEADHATDALERPVEEAAPDAAEVPALAGSEATPFETSVDRDEGHVPVTLEVEPEPEVLAVDAIDLPSSDLTDTDTAIDETDTGDAVAPPLEDVGGDAVPDEPEQSPPPPEPERVDVAAGEHGHFAP
ncbi:MAG: hypothetical protein QOF81_3543, partial [Acidimicrobiaceae bacterium]|nr:hypothetical protein [Acidimicrobiaceae bacterium]